MSRILVALALLLAIAASLQANESDANIKLTVTCLNANPRVGQAILSLFPDEASFLKKPLISRIQKIDSEGKATFALSGLKPGNYAVSVIYDQDSDGELATGFMGIPKEPVGFSNNAKGRFGPPSFKKCAFELKDELVIEIRLVEVK